MILTKRRKTKLMSVIASLVHDIENDPANLDHEDETIYNAAYALYNVLDRYKDLHFSLHTISTRKNTRFAYYPSLFISKRALRKKSEYAQEVVSRWLRRKTWRLKKEADQANKKEKVIADLETQLSQAEERLSFLTERLAGQKENETCKNSME